MPLRKGKANISWNIRELRKAHPEWSRERIIAAAMHAAMGSRGMKRRAGR